MMKTGKSKAWCDIGAITKKWNMYNSVECETVSVQETIPPTPSFISLFYIYERKKSFLQFSNCQLSRFEIVNIQCHAQKAI